MKYISIIEDYFLGKLEGEALESFSQDLIKNTELQNEFLAYKRAMEFILSQEKQLVDDLGRLKDFEFDPGILEDIEKYGTKKNHGMEEFHFKSILETEEKSRLINNTKRIINNKWYKLAACVIIILGIASVIVLKKPQIIDEDELFIKYFTPYEHSVNSRSLSDFSNRTLREGISFYDKGSYQQALNKLQQIPDTNEINSEVEIIRSVCLIKLEQYSQAIDILNKIDNSSLVYYTSLWYKGLCYLKLKEDIKAKEIFKKIYSFEPCYKDETHRLLKYLK